MSSMLDQSMSLFEVSLHIVTSLGEALREIWVEAVVIAVALHVYLRVSNSSFLTFKGRLPKVQKVMPSDSGSQKSSAAVQGCKLNSEVGAKRTDAAEVQRLVAGLLRSRTANISSCNKEHVVGSPEALLRRYDDLICTRRIDLRQYITDEQNARSLYIGLVGCAAQSAVSLHEAGSESSSRSRTTSLLGDMRGFAFSRDQEFYAALLKIFVNNRLLEDALWMYDVMVADGITPDRGMYISLLNAAVLRNGGRKAVYFFKELAKLGAPSMRSYMTVLRIHQRNQDWKSAIELLSGMKPLGISPDALVLNTVLGQCISSGRVDAAEKLLQQWPESADVISYNTLIKGHAQQANLPKAEAMLQQMLKGGPKPNLITFNTVMDCAVRALQAQTTDKQAHSTGKAHVSTPFSALIRRPWELVKQLKEEDLAPDRYTCSTLVKGMHIAGCSSSDIDGAMRIMRDVGPAGLQAPCAGTGDADNKAGDRLLEVVFNTLLDACVSVRNLDLMAEIVQMMEEFQVTVSAVTYGTLIKAFGQAGQLENCHETWQRMKESSINPTIVTFGCYIDACIRSGDVSKAECIFQSMPEQGIKPNAVVYTTLIRGLAGAKQPLKALELYSQMRQAGVEANAVTFNSVLDVIARQLSDPAKIQEVIDDMHKANIAPDVVTYSILIKASCTAGNISSALTLFRQIRCKGMVFDDVAFNTLLLACSKAGQVSDAEQIFEEMVALGVSPTHVTTSILVKMYGKMKMLDKAIEASEMIERTYGKKPNLYVYTCLIQACVQNKQIRRSWDIFGHMLRSAVTPDAITYGAVINSCVYCNKFEQAMALVRHAYGKPQPVSILGTHESTPFAADLARSRIAEPVPLQTEVLKGLAAALRRKDQTCLAEELDEIMGASGEGKSPQRNMRRQ